MKIINIVPGFGGTFYCGNCLRDSAFTTSLRAAGHQAMMLPMYLPLTRDSEIPADIPVFYGAVNIYLKQQFPFLKGMPGWLERFFNSAAVLKFAAGKSGSTRASGLEELTESMLLGSKGNQSQELQQLIGFLKYREKPDIVHFSNALLLGMAGEIRKELGVPIVCSLQDEDVWVDAMSDQHRRIIWKLLAEDGKDVDAFIPVSSYYAKVMTERMQIPESKIHTIPIGIDPGKYTCHEPVFQPPVIGYLSRICEENGFGILVDAFINLKSRAEFRSLRLIATGGYTNDDKRFIRKQISKLRAKKIEQDMEIIHDFSPPSLPSYFSKLSVLSVPVLKGEAFGLYQLEALASGIPIVQPALGAFPEIIANTGGGMTYHPNSPENLADAIAVMLSNKNELMKMSLRGREAVLKLYDSKNLTISMLSVYESVLKQFPSI